MTTVLTYGTFDLFHYGHVRLLKRLQELGDRLVVGLSSDEFNALKGKKTIIPYEHRREILLACRYVDHVFSENNWQQKPNDIEREKADIFAMGDDWVGKFDDLSELTEVIYLPRTRGISTTDVKQFAQAQHADKVREIKFLTEQLSEKMSRL